MTTKIEWCDEAWNPITGCTPISEGCLNCYAARMAKRLAGRCGYPARPNQFDVTFHGDRLNQPLKWKKARKIFVCSMGDLFHDDVEDWQHDRVFDRVLYDGISHHIWMILTKRPVRMSEYFKSIDNMQSSFDNAWLGVTAENQKRYKERWEILSQIPAAVKFLSIEPALEYVNIDILGESGPFPDWVIWGPETGPGKRPHKDVWAELTHEVCQFHGIPFFDKRKDYLAREFPK